MSQLHDDSTLHLSFRLVSLCQPRLSVPDGVNANQPLRLHQVVITNISKAEVHLSPVSALD